MNAHRMTRTVLTIIVAGTLLVTSACSTAAPSTAPDPTPVRAASILDIAKSIVSAGYDGYKYLKKCTKNQELGQPCSASDGDNIRQTLKEVRELRTQIENNQQQAMQEFDSMRNMIRDDVIRRGSDNLRTMTVNSDAAGYAYEALAVCAVSTTGECSPYIGQAGAPAEPVDTAIEKTQEYFMEKAANMPQDILVTASWFTGEKNRPQDGLAAAIWLYNKGIQDQQAGVTDTKIKESTTVPVVSPGLAASTNQDLKYWTEAYSKYAFFMVMYRGIAAGDAKAESAQAEVNTAIASEKSRAAVLGAANAYAFPEMGETGVILTSENKAWIMQPAQSLIGRAINANDVSDLANITNPYTPIETLAAQVPNTLPTDRWYSVETPVNKVHYNKLTVTFYPAEKDVDATWLVDASAAKETCPTKVRPLNTPAPRPARALDSTVWKNNIIVQTQPRISPENLFKTTWEKFAKSEPVEYAWTWKDIPGKQGPNLGLYMGWGAWVTCTTDGYGSIVALDYLPAGMGAAK